MLGGQFLNFLILLLLEMLDHILAILFHLIPDFEHLEVILLLEIRHPAVKLLPGFRQFLIILGLQSKNIVIL